MILEFHNQLAAPQRVEVTRVVVYDRLDNPVALAVELEPGLILTSTAEHPDFNSILHELGLHKTVIVKGTTPRPLEEIRFHAGEL